LSSPTCSRELDAEKLQLALSALLLLLLATLLLLLLTTTTHSAGADQMQRSSGRPHHAPTPISSQPPVLIRAALLLHFFPTTGIIAALSPCFLDASVSLLSRLRWRRAGWRGLRRDAGGAERWRGRRGPRAEVEAGGGRDRGD